MRTAITTPTNLLVRIPITGHPIATIIDRHNALAESRGTVCFGIRGRGPSNSRCAILLEQEARGVITYLYVVQRGKREFQAFRARLLSMSAVAPETHMFPAYYLESDIAEKASLWINVQKFTPVDNHTLETLRIDATGTPLLDVLSRSMACVMVVS